MTDRKQIGILALAMVSFAGVGATPPGRSFYSSVRHFVRYYKALEGAEAKVGFLGRAALSVVLASTEPSSKTKPAHTL